jgi:hypothetical protein
MTEISISLSGVTGVDWPRWQRLAREEESSRLLAEAVLTHFVA